MTTARAATLLGSSRSLCSDASVRRRAEATSSSGKDGSSATSSNASSARTERSLGTVSVSAASSSDTSMPRPVPMLSISSSTPRASRRIVPRRSRSAVNCASPALPRGSSAAPAGTLSRTWKSGTARRWIASKVSPDGSCAICSGGSATSLITPAPLPAAPPERA